MSSAVMGRCMRMQMVPSMVVAVMVPAMMVCKEVMWIMSVMPPPTVVPAPSRTPPVSIIIHIYAGISSGIWSYCSICPPFTYCRVRIQEEPIHPTGYWG